MDVISTKNSRYSSHDIGSLIEIGGIEYSDLTFDKKIGEGGFGSVYKGTHKKTVVAIKEVTHIQNSLCCIYIIMYLSCCLVCVYVYIYTCRQYRFSLQKKERILSKSVG